MDDTYVLALDAGAITCLICGMTSYHPQDVAFRYCGNCKLFHLSPLPGQIAQLRARQLPPADSSAPDDQGHMTLSNGEDIP